MSIRSELMEICKTGANKSSPGLFNFCVLLAGHELITDVNKATNCLFEFKNPLIYSNCTKNERHSENMVLNGKKFLETSDGKKTETVLSTFRRTPRDTRAVKSSTESRSCKQ